MGGLKAEAVVNTVEDNPGEQGVGRAVRAERCQLCWVRDAQTDYSAHELGVTESLRTGRPGGCAEDGCRVTGMGGITVWGAACLQTRRPMSAASLASQSRSGWR